MIDPGPSVPSHLEAIAAEVSDAQGVLLTHDHADHSEAAPALASRLGVPVVDATDHERIGPFDVLYIPGHADDHHVFVAGRHAFTGDAVLGEGSVFIWPHPGSLAGYLAALRRLGAMDLDVLCPGHGPPVADPAAKLDQYVAHRLDRERRLITALDDGLRSTDELLDRVWDDAPAALRPAAAVTLAAHLDKLADEGRLPEGVERPALPDL